MNQAIQHNLIQSLNKIDYIDDWLLLLEQINRQFDVQLTQLLAVDLDVQALSFSIHHSLNIDQEYLNRVALTNIRLEINDDPRLQKSVAAPFQGWMHDSQHFTQHEIQNTQVYEQVLQPLNIQYGSAIQLIYDQKICVILALLTSPARGALSTEELQPIYEIAPLIQQKIQQHRHNFEYSTRTLLGSQLIQKMKQPMAIINLNGTILEINGDARALFERHPEMYIQDRRFVFRREQHHEFNKNLFELEYSHNQYAIPSYEQRGKVIRLDHQLFLTLDLLLPETSHKIFGLRPVVLATFSGIKQKVGYQTDLFSELFMFTPVEHKICEHLLELKTLKSIASALNIQVDTARKHLQSIFKKTRTNRQSELMQLLMQFL